MKTNKEHGKRIAARAKANAPWPKKLTRPLWHAIACDIASHPQTIALLDHMAGSTVSAEDRAKRTGSYIIPGARFNITSDGFAMVDFVSAQHGYKLGAFFGDWNEVATKIADIAHHMKAAGHAQQCEAMCAALKSTIGQDWRS